MTISYTITSSTGEETHQNIDITKGLEDIVKLGKEQNKWIFINGVQITPESLTKKDLLGENKIIMLTDMLLGG